MSVATLPPPTEWGPAPPEVVPDLSRYRVEDGKPVDSIYHGYQHRLLVDSLQASWAGPGDGRPYFVAADCGLFYGANEPPLAPDVMLSLDVRIDALADPLARRSYFAWVVGKVPEVVIEMVSITPGGEDTTKLDAYARIGIPYYAIFDPHHFLSADEFRLFGRRKLGYERMDQAHLEGVGLGLTVWDGVFGGSRARWLRWTDAAGTILPTGSERAAAAEQRAEAEQQRAEAEQQRAEAAEERARELEERLARYAARLRDAGMSVNGE